jgi:hypothetical protein
MVIEPFGVGVVSLKTKVSPSRERGSRHGHLGIPR